jgi:hypothetical protein
MLLPISDESKRTPAMAFRTHRLGVLDESVQRMAACLFQHLGVLVHFTGFQGTDRPAETLREADAPHDEAPQHNPTWRSTRQPGKSNVVEHGIGSVSSTTLLITGSSSGDGSAVLRIP